MSNLVIDKLEKLINKTPTGDLRNELTDINILIQSDKLKWNDYETKKPDLSKLSERKNKSISCLVELEERNEKVEYVIATFHPKLITVGGHFDFDQPPIKRWIYLDDILSVLTD